MNRLPLFIFLLLITQGSLFAQPVLPYKLQELQKERKNIIHKYNPVFNGNLDSLDQPVYLSEGPESEVHAAINPTDPQHIIVAAINQSGLSLKFSIYVTFNGGESWEQSNFDGINPDLTTQGGGDPMLGFTTEGTPYFSWLTVSGEGDIINFDGFVRLNRATSPDGGLNWEIDPQPISATPISITFIILIEIDSFVDKQWMVTDHSLSSPHYGNEYTAFAKLYFPDQNTVDYGILVKTKTPEDSIYTENSTVVNGDISYLSQFVSLDLDKDGNIHLIFVGQNEIDEFPGIYYVQSTDGGSTFSPPALVSYLQLECFPNDGTTCTDGILGVDNMRVYPCAHIRADKSGGEYDGNLYITFTANGLDGPAAEGADLFFAQSEDQGSSWSTPQVVNPVPATANDDFYSMIEVNPEGVINLSWYDRNEDPENVMTHYYTAFSRDGGNSFEEGYSVTSIASDFSAIGTLNNGFGIGEYNAAVSSSDHFYLFWGDGRSNDGNINVYMAKLNASDSISTSFQELSTISPLFNVGPISPNPVTDQLQFELALQQSSPVQVELYDIQGRKLGNLFNTNLQEGEHLISIDNLSQYEAAQYICLIRTRYGFKSMVFTKT